jgi:hypothetical protein
MARANLKKNENLATNTTEVSEYVHTQETQALHQFRPQLQMILDLSSEKFTSLKCLHPRDTCIPEVLDLLVFRTFFGLGIV